MTRRRRVPRGVARRAGAGALRGAAGASATPSALRIFWCSACSFGSSSGAPSASSRFTKAPSISGAICWYFLLTGDSSQAISCFSSSSVNFSSSTGPMTLGASSMARLRRIGSASSTNCLASASMVLPIASRLSAGTCVRSVWPAACISCITGRCTTVRESVSMAGCCSSSTLATSSFLAGEAVCACAAKAQPRSATPIQCLIMNFPQGSARRRCRSGHRSRRSRRCVAGRSGPSRRPGRSASPLVWRGRVRGFRKRGCARARRGR